jgi:DNA-binding NarL/FixJ family response regulator
MKVLLADDHDLVRDTVAAYLESEEGTKVTAVSTLDQVLSTLASDGPFDVVLLDLEMPGMNGLAGLRAAREANQGRPVGLISGTATHAVAEQALQEGAAGFLPKTLPAKSLLNAVRFMAAGEVFAPADFMAEKQEKPQHALRSTLSPREQEVLVGLTKGWSNKEIARELQVQEVTVKLHVKTLSRKLSARNRTHAAMIAKDSGFV